MLLLGDLSRVAVDLGAMIPSHLPPPPESLCLEMVEGLVCSVSPHCTQTARLSQSEEYPECHAPGRTHVTTYNKGPHGGTIPG